MKHLREQRWCLCGWTFTGNDFERRVAFVAHWGTVEHWDRLKASGRLPMLESEAK